MKILDFIFEEDVLLNNLEQFGTIMHENLISLNNPDVNNYLLYVDKKAFLEPSLSTYLLAQDNPNIDAIIQILWCYTDAKNRASRIKVKADQFGTIHLPNIGYYKGESNKSYTIFSDESKISFDEDNSIVNIKEEFQYLYNTNIKLIKHVPPFLGEIEKIKFVSDIHKQSKLHSEKVAKALGAIKELCFDLYNAIILTTKEIFLYDNLESNSFATIYSNGTCFINMENKDQSEVFFIDDVAHQCGHIVYYAITLNARKYLKMQRNTLMKDITGVAHDNRELYSAFHGLFTYTTIMACLDKYLESDEYTENHKKEALARIGFYMNKMRLDLGYLCSTSILTQEGFKFIDAFKSGYYKIYDKYRKHLQTFLYINQPYNFDMEEFKKDNNNF